MSQRIALLRTVLVLNLVLVLANLAFLTWRWLGEPLAWDEVVAAIGCKLPHADTVEFRQGMTLCPGQSAVGRMMIILRPQAPGEEL